MYGKGSMSYVKRVIVAVKRQPVRKASAGLVHRVDEGMVFGSYSCRAQERIVSLLTLTPYSRLSPKYSGQVQTFYFPERIGSKLPPPAHVRRRAWNSCVSEFRTHCQAVHAALLRRVGRFQR